MVMNMNAMFAGIIGGWELVLILAVVLVLFGAKKLPELAKGLGTGIKEFKKATRDVTEELHSAMDDNPPSRPYVPPSYTESVVPAAPAPPSPPAPVPAPGNPVNPQAPKA